MIRWLYLTNVKSTLLYYAHKFYFTMIYDRTLLGLCKKVSFYVFIGIIFQYILLVMNAPVLLSGINPDDILLPQSEPDIPEEYRHYYQYDNYRLTEESVNLYRQNPQTVGNSTGNMRSNMFDNINTPFERVQPGTSTIIRRSANTIFQQEVSSPTTVIPTIQVTLRNPAFYINALSTVAALYGTRRVLEVLPIDKRLGGLVFIGTVTGVIYIADDITRTIWREDRSYEDLSNIISEVTVKNDITVTYGEQGVTVKLDPRSDNIVDTEKLINYGIQPGTPPEPIETMFNSPFEGNMSIISYLSQNYHMLIEQKPLLAFLCVLFLLISLTNVALINLGLHVLVHRFSDKLRDSNNSLVKWLYNRYTKINVYYTLFWFICAYGINLYSLYSLGIILNKFLV